MCKIKEKEKVKVKNIMHCGQNKHFISVKDATTLVKIVVPKSIVS